MDDKQVSSSQPDLLHNTSSPRPLLSPRSHPPIYRMASIWDLGFSFLPPTPSPLDRGYGLM